MGIYLLWKQTHIHAVAWLWRTGLGYRYTSQVSFRRYNSQHGKNEVLHPNCILIKIFKSCDKNKSPKIFCFGSPSFFDCLRFNDLYNRCLFNRYDTKAKCHSSISENKSSFLLSRILEIKILTICLLVIIPMYFHFVARRVLFKH